MQPPLDIPDVDLESLQEAEDRALAALRASGLERFVDGFESDEGWTAFNEAAGADQNPVRGLRAHRARTVLLLIELIRAALNDGDFEAVFRHTLAVGALDRDLIGRAERDALVSRRVRGYGQQEALKARRRRRDDNRKEWVAEANWYRTRHAGASDVAVAKHVAEACGAKPETVRKNLRAVRQLAQVSTKK